MQVVTIGLDLGKHVLQVHGVDAAGNVVLRRRLRRAQVHAFFAGLKPCLVSMEACATAHFWARELRSIGRGEQFCHFGGKRWGGFRNCRQERCRMRMQIEHPQPTNQVIESLDGVARLRRRREFVSSCL